MTYPLATAGFTDLSLGMICNAIGAIQQATMCYMYATLGIEGCVQKHANAARSWWQRVRPTFSVLQ